ncbi:Uncharacterised protein [Candidatus Tiddalikarchaeum anstoanum]|nr:Uncharacterised protein [Candidatus Tiddalikarchaeum anstoanum]
MSDVDTVFPTLGGIKINDFNPSSYSPDEQAAQKELVNLENGLIDMIEPINQAKTIITTLDKGFKELQIKVSDVAKERDELEKKLKDIQNIKSGVGSQAESTQTNERKGILQSIGASWTKFKTDHKTGAKIVKYGGVSAGIGVVGYLVWIFLL